jgi:hypothetical protein
MEKLANGIRQLGGHVDDNMYKAALLASLTEKYEIFATSMRAVLDTVAVPDMHARLMLEEHEMLQNFRRRRRRGARTRSTSRAHRR